MSDAGHSYLGASNMHRWSACPGSFELNKTAPPGKSGRAALVGTLSHKLAEEMYKTQSAPGGAAPEAQSDRGAAAGGDGKKKDDDVIDAEYEVK